MDVFKLMQKPFDARTESEIKAISECLIRLDSFKDILNSLEEKFQIDRLNNISTFIKCNFVDKHKIVFKFGDRISNYNLILKGKATILIPRKEKIFMTEEDYITYLLKLRKYNEHTLLEQSISDNQQEFEIPNNFDNWMNNYINTYHSPLKSENSKNNVRLKKSETVQNNSIIDTIKETLRYCSENKDEILISCEGYINRINHKVAGENKSTGEKKLVTVYRYVASEVLESGGKLREFGEKNINMNYSCVNENNLGHGHMNSSSNNHSTNNLLASSGSNNSIPFNPSNNKTPNSPFTLITEEESYFGWIQNSTYNKIIKEFNDKNKKVMFYAIISYDVFKNISLFNLERKYLQYFKSANFKRGEYVINQNDLISSLYFLKSGEFELSVSLSVIDVIQLIQLFIKYSEFSSSEKFFIIKDEISNEAHLFNKEEDFKKKFIHKKRIKMGIIKDKEIIGLQDLIYLSNLLDSNLDNNHSIFSVKCLSERSETFQISIEEFKSIIEKENLLKENVLRYLKNKGKFYVDKLENYLLEQYELYKHREKQEQMKVTHEKTFKIDERFNILSYQRKANHFTDNSEKFHKTENKNKNPQLNSLNLVNNIDDVNFKHLEEKNSNANKNVSKKTSKLGPTFRSTTKLPRLNSLGGEKNSRNNLKKFESKDTQEFKLNDLTEKLGNSNTYFKKYKMKIIKKTLFDTVINNYLKRWDEGDENLKIQNKQRNKSSDNFKHNVIDFLIMDKFKYIYSSVLNSANTIIIPTDKNHNLLTRNFNIPILTKKFDKIKLRFADTKFNLVNPEKDRKNGKGN